MWESLVVRLQRILYSLLLAQNCLFARNIVRKWLQPIRGLVVCMLLASFTQACLNQDGFVSGDVVSLLLEWKSARLFCSVASVLTCSERGNLHFLFGWFEVGWAIWAQMSQIGVSQIWAPVDRHYLPKVCVQQFHGQDEDWFRIFWALLVHFGLGIMCKEGICQIWIFGFLRSKRSNLEVQKK